MVAQNRVDFSGHPPSPTAKVMPPVGRFEELSASTLCPSPYGNPVERVEVRPVREGGRYVVTLPPEVTLIVMPRVVPLRHDLDGDGRADVACVYAVEYLDADGDGRPEGFVVGHRRFDILDPAVPFAWSPADTERDAGSVCGVLLANTVDRRLAGV